MSAPRVTIAPISEPLRSPQEMPIQTTPAVGTPISITPLPMATPVAGSPQELTPLLTTADTGKKKKKKLTKEERKELKKQKKILKKQRELEEKKQQFRDFLERELKYTEITYKRAAADWEAMCAAIKLKELKDDMTELWQSLNRSLDNKQYKIQTLLTELDIAEEQYRRNFSKHCDIIDYLIRLFKVLVEMTKNAYDQDAADLVAEFQEDLEEKNEIHAARKKYYENVLHATNLITKNLLTKMEHRYTIDVNELVDTHVAKRLQYRDATVRKMEQLHAHIEKIVSDLQMDALNPKREQLYNQCVERQEQASKDMQTFRESSKRLLSTLSSYQTELLSSESESKAEVVRLRGERSYFVEQYWRLKQSHKQSTKSHDNHIKGLAYESDRSMKNLKKYVKYGELILGLATCCRKLQTEKEKVTPWTEEAENLRLDAGKQNEDVQDQVTDQVRQMQLFWNRVGQAEIHVLCLQEEKQALEKENENFREIIKSYGEAQSYNRVMCSLQISPYPTSTIPIQEASQMPQLKKP